MIPTFVTKTADILQQKLSEIGFNFKVEKRKRRLVALTMQRSEAMVSLCVRPYEVDVWFSHNSVCMDGMDLGYCIVRKKRKQWSCGCGAADCKVTSYLSRQKLLDELFIQPVMEVFQKVGEGDYLDFYFDKAYEGMTMASFRVYGSRLMSEFEPTASVWVAPEKPEPHQLALLGGEK